jgi:Gas vesicle synthesis protein GvpL/GvpF
MTQTKAATDFLYLYGVIPTVELQETEAPLIIGIDQKNVLLKCFKELTAIITPVNPQYFSQQQIELQLKDAEWLKEKALHHHETIAAIHQHFTILPLSFCTIFQNEPNLESLLTEQYEVLIHKLSTLKGRQEWNLKLYCSTERALNYVTNHNPAVIELKGKLASMPKGKQFIMKKKLEQLIASELGREQSHWWVEIQKRLKSDVADSNLRRNWGKEVTERVDDMIVNCDFLIEKMKSESFINKIRELEKSFEALGCKFQITGPWPPYHFSKIEKEI